MSSQSLVWVSVFVGLFLLGGQTIAIPAEVRGPAASAAGGPASVHLGGIDDVDLEDVRGTFGEVFARLPEKLTVYPSENYLYYRFHTGGREMWGNIRLSPEDRDAGVAHFAYYEFNPSPTGPDDFALWYRAMGAADGLSIARDGAFRYALTFDGRTVEFALHEIEQSPPRLFRPAADERIVFKTYDESRFQFFLVFNVATHRFLYVLNEEEAVPDAFASVGRDVLVGVRSGFAFYLDRANQNRKILMGVSVDNIKQNNYYDGPFDQLADNYVGPDSKLSEYIQAAYPYTRGRVDPYGKFVDVEGSRVAITPYVPYATRAELVETVDWCRSREAGPQFYACIAYDDKTRFGAPSEPTAEESDPVDPLAPPHDPLDSLNWPDGHSVQVSRTWGPHLSDISKNWPPDHNAVISKDWGVNHDKTVSLSWPRDHRRVYSEDWPRDHAGIRSRSWPENHKYDRSKTWPEGHAKKISKHWPESHIQARSLSWPPNHANSASTTWPGSHTAEISRIWPADHREFFSTKWGTSHAADRSGRWPPNHSVKKSENIP